MDTKAALIDGLFDRGLLAHPELLEQSLDHTLLSKLEQEGDLLILTADYMDLLSQQGHLIDWYDLDRYRVSAEKERDHELYARYLSELRTTPPFSSPPSFQQTPAAFTALPSALAVGGIPSVLLPPPLTTASSTDYSSPLSPPVLRPAPLLTQVVSFQNIPKKYAIADFTRIFHSRHRFLERLLRQRHGLESALAMHRLRGKQDRGPVSVIGSVYDIQETKSGNRLVTLEDPTGFVKILISQNKSDLYKESKELVLDEIVGISGASGDQIIFADAIFWPEVPIVPEQKKGSADEYAVFLSDAHVGSKLFLHEAFDKFLLWIKGEMGNDEQRAIAEKIRYVFIAGDLVDGVGVYPGQEEELEILELGAQYRAFCQLIAQIPRDKRIIVCPGNHDAVHLAEPQSLFYEEYAQPLYQLPNVTVVTNPGQVTIGQTDTFPGFTVLLYHGYSFDYYISHVESIRTNGGYHRADLVMKFLLRKRHLAPTFGSTPYFPGPAEDPLLIREVPDFFLSGHIHYSKVANYRQTTLICGSCWQGKTSFQEKLGHEPEPGRVPVVNLQTRDIKILKFI